MANDSDQDILVSSPLAKHHLKPISLEDDSKDLMVIIPEVKTKPLRFAKTILVTGMLHIAAGALAFFLMVVECSTSSVWTGAKWNGLFVAMDVCALLGTVASTIAGALGVRLSRASKSEKSVLVRCCWCSCLALLPLGFSLSVNAVCFYFAAGFDGPQTRCVERGLITVPQDGRVGPGFVFLIGLLLSSGLLAILMMSLLYCGRDFAAVKQPARIAYFVVAVDKPSVKQNDHTIIETPTDTPVTVETKFVESPSTIPNLQD